MFLCRKASLSTLLASASYFAIMVLISQRKIADAVLVIAARNALDRSNGKITITALDGISASLSQTQKSFIGERDRFSTLFPSFCFFFAMN